MDHALRAAFDASGRIWLRNALSTRDLELFDSAVAGPFEAGQRLDPSQALKGALSADGALLRAVRRLDPKAVPVRMVAFNKTETANWGVPWHQDRVIAVAERAEVAGYRNWTRKSGTWHCEPPLSILEDMLFVRVHLDDTDRSNGAMQIAVGSHAGGIVPSAKAEQAAIAYLVELCDAKRGDVLLLNMLTLHASQPARVQSGRRTLRIDFASCDLPAPLSWNGFWTGSWNGQARET